MPLTSVQLIRLDDSIKAAGVAIIGIDTDGNVSPASLQAAAQPTINSFDTSQAAQDLWELRKKTRKLGTSFAVRKTADENFSTTSFANVADLEFELDADSHYGFRFTGGYTTAVATTGLQLSIDGPGAPVVVRAVGQIAETATTVRNGALASYDVAIAGLASAGGTAMLFWIEGNITTGATPGKLILRARSETGGSDVTILRGSQGILFGVS